MRDPSLSPYAGSRFVNKFVPSTVDNLINGLSATLTTASWTLLTNTTSNGHPYVVYQSAQSPWWDETTPVPSTYVGKVNLNIYWNNNDLNAGVPNGARLFVTNSAGDIAQNTFSNAVFLGTSTSTMTAIGNPFQLVAYINGQTGNNTSAIISALQTPQFLQKGYHLTECLVNFDASEFRTRLCKRSGNTGDFAAISDNGGTRTGAGQCNDNGGARFLTICGAQLGTFSNDMYKAANVIDDSGFTDQTKWYPFLMPPTLGWGETFSVGPMHWKGYLWDALLVTNNYNDGDTLTFPDGHIYTAFTVQGTGVSSLPGTLFFCTAPATD